MTDLELKKLLAAELPLTLPDNPIPFALSNPKPSL